MPADSLDTSGSAQREGTGNAKPGLVLAGAVLGFFIITLDSLVVNVALPVIGDDIGGGITGLQWVVDGYTLMFASLMLTAGALIDRVGASRTYGGGLALFTLASVGCAVAGSLGLLVAARLVQGCAASVIMPASLALIRQAYPDTRQRVRALAMWTAGGAVAAAAGPVIGGVLTSSLGWRSIFLLNLPVGIVTLLLLRNAPRPVRRPAPVDWPGQITGIVALGALTYGVIEGGAHGFQHAEVIITLVVAAIALGAFVAIEARREHPMLPLHLVRSKFVAVPSVVGATISVAFYGGVFILGLYFQQGRGRSPFEAGLMFLPMTTAVAVLNLLVVARLISSRGPRFTILLGQGVTAADLVAIAAVGDRVSDVALAVLIVPICFAGGVAVPAAMALLMDNVPVERTGTASAVMNTFRQIGTALAIAVFGALLAGMGSMFAGLRVSTLVAAALLVVSMTVVVSVIPRSKGE